MQTNRSVYIETYGCQMNMADTEIVLSIMREAGFTCTETLSSADIVLINTCAVRDNAEQRIIGRLGDFNHYKKANPNVIVGVLGCMAERVRDELMELGDFVDLVIGPDEYRKLPALIEAADSGEKGIAVKLSRVEKYDDIVPFRTDGLSAWISIMRGCDKFCTYCVVPFTRGRERSRSLASIISEMEDLSRRGFKEATLLGQNVNSYSDGAFDFADLLVMVADVDKKMRIRFMTSHPQDMSDKLIDAIASRDNICHYIHLPVQSGSNRILELMNRTYTRDQYFNLVCKIKKIIPDVSLSTDIISGFPTETEDDHKKTLELLHEVEFDGAYTFKYSPREHTKAWHMGDDVPEETKNRRLSEIIDLQRTISLRRNKTMIGDTVEVLVEGLSKKSVHEFCGRTDTNKMVVFPKNGDAIGDYIGIRIERANSATLFGTKTGHQLPQFVILTTQEG
ncbi:MAG: tRNA (N6-isopentenyl adenosine(37)-C2)-methylthiotransferase MiaB [Ignavibacteriales bacterium]|nr:tRNA (N6-isopentenyl adenosine(37)-C2)-methylthiotransferase MiaB [Ignavibacteriales bacterium]